MNTKIIYLDEDNIDEAEIEFAGKILKSGGLVAFPTETVYGLGADATNVEAVKKIFEAKGRPQDNPLIVHVADFENIKDYVEEVPYIAEKIMEAF